MVSQCLSFREDEYILTGCCILSSDSPTAVAPALSAPVLVSRVPRGGWEQLQVLFLGSFCEVLMHFGKAEESVVANKQTLVLLQLQNTTGLLCCKLPLLEWHPVLVS